MCTVGRYYILINNTFVNDFEHGCNVPLEEIYLGVFVLIPNLLHLLASVLHCIHSNYMGFCLPRHSSHGIIRIIIMSWILSHLLSSLHNFIHEKQLVGQHC